MSGLGDGEFENRYYWMSFYIGFYTSIHLILQGMKTFEIHEHPYLLYPIAASLGFINLGFCIRGARHGRALDNLMEES